LFYLAILLTVGITGVEELNDELCIERDVEGSGCGQISSTVLEFEWSN